MKKFYSLILIIILAITPGLTQSNYFAGGDGSSTNPFLIATAEHLDNIRNVLDINQVYYFRQVADIDLSAYSNWEPIGGNGTEVVFNGVYNGQHYTISNLTINRPGSDNVGLFGHAASGDQPNFGQISRVRNIVLKNINVTGNNGVGALVGRQSGSERNYIEACFVLNGTVSGNSGVGGIVGYNVSFNAEQVDPEGFRPIVRRSFSNVAVNGSGNAIGGAIGANYKGIIENIYSLGVVNASSATAVGGLAGRFESYSIVINSYAAGMVNASGATVGGFSGQHDTSQAPVSISSSYWDTERSGQSGSAGGQGRTTLEMSTQSNFSNWNFTSVWNIMEGEYYPFLRDLALSGFNIIDPGEQMAGVPFSLEITQATDVGGILLDGEYRVTIHSDLLTEGTEGLIADFAVTFSQGNAIFPEITLFRAGMQNLQIDIETILMDEFLPLPVRSGYATELVILEQPSIVSGNNDDQPAVIGPIVVAAVDAWGNISGEGLNNVQEISVAIFVDGSPTGDANLGNTAILDIQEGMVTFQGLTLDKEGTGYVLRFSSLGAGRNVSLGTVDSEPFDVVAIDDLSGFVVLQPQDNDSRLILEPFTISIDQAMNTAGVLLSGAVNVQVQSSLEGMIFNRDVNFTSGAASFTAILENLGSHNLTITIDGITLPRTINNINAVSDFSGFSLSLVPAEGPYYAAIPFTLQIRGARDFNDYSIEFADIIITSDLEDVIFEEIAVNFLPGTGDVDLEIVLMMPSVPGVHTLTVEVEGVTAPRTIDVTVEENISGFDLVIGEIFSGIAGTDLPLEITNAFNATTATVDFTGLYRVQVLSDLVQGSVFDAEVQFINGEAFLEFPLLRAGTHNLTVNVSSIAGSQILEEVVIIPAEVVSLVIVSGDVADVFGNNDGSPARVGPITLEAQDAFGNRSALVPFEPQDVTAVLIPVGGSTGVFSSSSVTLGNIATGEYSFEELFITDEGEYYIEFSTDFDLDENPYVIITNTFRVFNVDNQAGFEIVDPGPQVVNIPFNLELINARSNNGSLLTGNLTVQIRPQGSPFTLFNGTVSFDNGEGYVPVNFFTESGSFELEVRIVDIAISELMVFRIVETDLSVFDLVDVGVIAGNPFTLEIENALNKAGNPLDNKSHLVTITSNNTTEGDNGLLYSGMVPFTGGNASVADLMLTTAKLQTLTVTIDWVTAPKTTEINVVPNTATRFVFVQQPIGFSDGAFEGIARRVGEVILQTLDEWGNQSMAGLTVGPDNEYTILAEIESGPEGAILSGSTTAVLVDGEAIFPELLLDKNGTYTLRFTFTGGADPEFAPNPLVSNSFDMVNIENLEGFTLIQPGKQYENLPFVLQLVNARDQFGNLLEGNFTLSLTSNEDGLIYDEQEFEFTAGALDMPLTLIQVATHEITVNIPVLTDNGTGIIFIEVAPDLSGFSLAHTPPVYQNNPFDLAISNAQNLDGVALQGAHRVNITSNIAGETEIFSGDVMFNLGSADISLNLPSQETYTLTVSIEGITATRDEVVSVLENQSGFLAELEIPGDKIAGESFVINLSEARGFDGVLLEGLNWVQVSSDLVPEVIFDGQIPFTEGTASLSIILELAQLHTLSLSITGITGSQELAVNVIPAVVSQLQLEVLNPPPGGPGTGDDISAPIGTIIIRTLDAFGNASVSGLGGLQTITASLTTDGSAAQNAILGGTLEISIETGEAVFNDLTLNKDGQGFVITFTYNGDPALLAVSTEAFDMAEVNLYLISLLDANEQILDVENPLVFDTLISGYVNPTAEIIQIIRLAQGDISQLTVSIDEVYFILTQPLENLLWDDMESTSFTIAPAEDLAPGVYAARVTVSGEIGVEQQFQVFVTVLAPWAMTLTDDLNQLLDEDNSLVFETVLEVYTPQSRTITIANTGANALENMEVVFTEGGTSFVLGTLSQTDILPGGTATFTLSPLADLAPGTYTATINVKDGLENVSTSFQVTFEVQAFTYALTVQPSNNLVLPTMTPGYNPANAARTITLTSTGTGPINDLALSWIGNEGYFIIEGELRPLTFQGDEITLTILPFSDLTVGIYEALLLINATYVTQKDIGVQFQVIEEHLWTGTISNVWGNAGNWQNESVPGNESRVRIPSGLGIYPDISQVRIVQELLMEEGSALTIAGTGRLSINTGGRFRMQNNAEVTAAGEIRILADAIMTMEPGSRLTSSGSFINNTGVDGLILMSDAQGSASFIHNSSGIQATVQRYMSGNKTHVMAPPVSGQSIQNFISTNPAITYNSSMQIYAMRHYDPASGWAAWYTASTTGNMLAGRAYSILLTSSTQVTYRGTLRHNNLVVNIPYNPGAFGWNGIGNPYTSNIGAREAAVVEDFLTLNHSQLAAGYEAIYLYDPDLPAGFRYHIINNTITGFEKNYLSHGQGFIVKAKDGNSKITFAPAMRAHQADVFYKSQPVDNPWHSMRLIATGGTKRGQTFVSFNRNMTHGMDVTYDAVMYVEDNSFKLYTRMPGIESNLNLGVQALPDYDYNEMVIPVGFRHTQGGSVTFSLASADLPAYLSPILEDKELGKFVNLKDEPYIVNIPAQTQPEETGRFFIHMKDTRIFYAVSFAAQNPGGDVLASVSGKSLSTGEKVEKGAGITFTAAAWNNFALDYWIVNGEVVDGQKTDQLTLSGLNKDISVYAVFRSTLSDDARLEELLVNGSLLQNFSPGQLHYHVALPEGSESLPVVDGTAFHPNAQITIVQAQSLTGETAGRTATLTVTAEDNASNKVYTVLFTVGDIQMYTVVFGAGDAFGTLTANVAKNQVNSGDVLPEGTSITFLATPDPDYVIGEWRVGGTVVEGYTHTEYIHGSLQGDLNIQVYFKEAITQIDETVNGNNLILYIFDRRLVIRGAVESNTRAVLYDMLGREMHIEYLKEGEYNSFSVEGLQTGVYMLHLSSPQTNHTRKLFVD